MTLLNEAVNLLLHIDLQDIVPLRSLTETALEWIPHSLALTHITVKDENKETE